MTMCSFHSISRLPGSALRRYVSTGRTHGIDRAFRRSRASGLASGEGRELLGHELGKPGERALPHLGAGDPDHDGVERPRRKYKQQDPTGHARSRAVARAKSSCAPPCLQVQVGDRPRPVPSVVGGVGGSPGGHRGVTYGGVGAKPFEGVIVEGHPHREGGPPSRPRPLGPGVPGQGTHPRAVCPRTVRGRLPMRLIRGRGPQQTARGRLALSGVPQGHA
jgi:hypothetical protein